MAVTLLNPAYPTERLYDRVIRILEDNNLCSMATNGEKERVHINTAFFCFSDQLDLHFLSDPASIHCRNLSRSPHMAMTVFDSHQRWGAAHRGLQLFGHCTIATGPAENAAHELYSRRFPYAEFLSSLSPEKRQAFSLRFYSFTPATVKILDEEEFGEEVFVTAEVLK